jgi:hypothetical protein
MLDPDPQTCYKEQENEQNIRYSAPQVVSESDYAGTGTVFSMVVLYNTLYSIVLMILL